MAEHQWGPPIDNSTWDANAAMTAGKTASDYDAICAGRKEGEADQRGSWALPHHKRPGGPPNAAGVRAALAALGGARQPGGGGMQGLTNADAARSHLERHMRIIQAQRSEEKSSRERWGFEGDIEVRQEGDTATIEGYAAVFDSESQLLFGSFIETVSERAFDKTIKEADIVGLFNHDPNIVLGRRGAGTLKLATDTKGLHYEIDANLKKSNVRDLMEDIERGDVAGSSFTFRSIEDKWDYSARPMRRSLEEVAVHDVSPVTFPAYLATEVDLKRAMRSLANQSGKEEADLFAAAMGGELRSLFGAEPVESRDEDSRITLLRKQLQLKHSGRVFGALGPR